MNSRCLVRAATALLVACAAFAPLPAQTLSNLSTRAQVGIGVNVLVAGFTVAGGNKTVLLRAGGPALNQFGLTGTLANPKIELFRGDGTKLGENDDWGTPLAGATPVTASAFTSVGAFAFPSGSRDAALLVTLPPGNYSAQVSGVNNTTGLAIVEAYEVGVDGGRLTNLSTRAQVGTIPDADAYDLAVEPGSGDLVALFRDGIAAYDANTLRPRQAAQYCRGLTSYNFALSPDGRAVAFSLPQENTVLVADRATGMLRAAYRSGEWPLALAFSPDGSRLACLVGVSGEPDRNQRLQVITLATGRVLDLTAGFPLSAGTTVRGDDHRGTGVPALSGHPVQRIDFGDPDELCRFHEIYGRCDRPDGQRYRGQGLSGGL